VQGGGEEIKGKEISSCAMEIVITLVEGFTVPSRHVPMALRINTAV